ncbi:MAG: acyl-CoA dehydrogenase family protein [Xanthomonadales bacterium]|nr:acyl-CoA dehydrogenase family protein [Xanthomonadales bacterium]
MDATTTGPLAGSEEDTVVATIDRLLDEHPPAQADATEFWGAQFDAGLAWVHFPVGYGGLGVRPGLQELVNRRLRAAGAPNNYLENFVGVGTAAPTIEAFGTPEQKQRLLRPLFTCEEIWCQLFSEPDAGSDLASLATSAVRDGDEWVVNGHKVWTTMGHIATWGILVARTDPAKPKHEGLTYFLLDMNAPGVEVRPLRQISGEAEFNEVLFHDVRVPDAMRLGARGDGWRVTIGTLMNERSHNGDSAKGARGHGNIGYAMRLWSEFGDDDPARRDELMRLWTESEVIRLTALRADANRKSGTPGPEGSVLKLAVGLLPQRIFEFAIELMGPYGQLIGDYDFVQPTRTGEDRMGDGSEDIDIVKAFINARSTTIGGGTTEVQKNTIGERILGLPGEPRPDRGKPWNEVVR